MKISSAVECITSYDMSDNCFLDSDIQMVKEEVVGHSCQMCLKDGMDDDELKAHAIHHLDADGFESVAENHNNTKSTKSRGKSKPLQVSHIKCTVSKQNGCEHFNYSCTLCGMENIHISLISSHIKKECALFFNSVLQTYSNSIPSDGNTHNSRALLNIVDNSSIFNSIENYGSDNIVEEIITLFNPMVSEIGVPTCDISSLEHEVLEVNTPSEPKTVSKQSLVECIATAGDSTSIQSALVCEPIGIEDMPFGHLMEHSIVKESNSLKCHYCKEYFELEADLLKHQEIKHANSQTNLLCLICGKSFAKKNLLKRHVETHEADPSTCGVCNKTFHNKMMLKTHTMMHTGEHPFKCSVCEKGFIFSSSLKKHLSQEHKIITKDYKCNICTRAFKTNLGLKKHHQREHEGGGSQYLCPTCGKTFSNGWSLNWHMVIHGPRKHVCEICGFRFYSPHILKNHMLRHQRKKNFICETCGETFYQRTELNRHVFNQHTDDLPSKCTHCDKAFKFPRRLEKHMILTHRIIPEGKQVFTCNICSQLFLNKSKMNDHMNLHSGARPYSCSDCSHKFRSQHSLMQHREVHAVVRKPKNSFPCSVCSRKFKNERTWRLHNQSFHLGDTEKVSSFACDDCEKQFSTNWMLNRHKILYHSDNTNDGSQRYHCDLCEECFTSSGKLNNHKKEIHLVELPEEDPKCGDKSRPIHCRVYQCNQCEKAYPTSSGLYQHKQKKHNLSVIVRTYPCKLCGKILKSASALYLHGRCKHGLNPKDYSCDTCGRKFKLKGSLNSHQLTHIEIKDREVYTCPICFKDLTTKWSYQVHMRVHRGIKPHACDICGRAFTQSGDRNKHRLNAHKEIIQARESV